MAARLADIIDMTLLQTMLDSLWRATGIPLGLIDVDGKVLVATGWQKVCQQFHRDHPELAERCLLSERGAVAWRDVIGNSEQPVRHLCRSGLTDIVLPVICEGQYLGLLFLGQFFEQTPDREVFRQQAVALGADPEAYLALIADVPIIPPAVIEHHLAFHAAFIRLLSEVGLRTLREQEARAALVESETTFRSLFANANDGIAIAAADGRILAVNPAICRLLGYPQEALHAMTLFTLADPSVHEKIPRRIAEIRERGSVIFETLLRHADGSSVPVEVSSRLIQYRGEPALLGNVHDLTRRRQAEQALRESEERFRSIVHATPLGIHMYRLEGDGRLIFTGYNPAADVILGVDNSRFLEQELLEAFPGLASTELPERYRMVCRTGETWHAGQVTYEQGELSGVFEVHAFKTGPDRMASIFMDISERIRALEIIRAREATLHGILAAAPLSIGLSHERVFGWVNPWMCDEFGYREEELIGRCTRMLYESDAEFDRVGRIRALTVDQGQMGEIETRWLCRDGQVLDVLLRFMRVDPNDPRMGVIFTALNITRAKRDEHELRDREEQIRLLLDSSGEAIFGVDREGRCTFANPMCRELLGVTDETELLGHKTHDLMHHSWRDGSPYPEEECRIYQAFRCGDSVHAVGEWFWRVDGRGFPVEYWAHPIVRGGEVCGAVVNFIDITERQQAEQRLQAALTETQRAEGQVNAILQSVADALVVIDPQGRILTANPAALVLLGGADGDIIGAPVAGKFPDPQFLDKVDRVAAGSEPSAVFDMASWRDHSGHERILQVRMARIAEEDQGLHGAVTILRDVTREREIDRLKDEFISTAAHELRTPITSILGYAEMMLDQLPRLSATQLRDYLGVICNRSEALTQIVAEMLDLSRLQSGQVIPLSRQPGDLASLAREVVSHYRGAHDRHDLQLQIATPLPLVECDIAKLRQVFDNLLTNACKFSPQGSVVTISVGNGPEGVAVSVADQGVGMTPEQVERIFDKFYRADASTTAASGLGLGMSLVKGIIEGHGGRIWVVSAPGHGTTVTFTLPVVTAAGE